MASKKDDGSDIIPPFASTGGASKKADKAEKPAKKTGAKPKKKS